jgi:CBS domain-containing protein
MSVAGILKRKGKKVFIVSQTTAIPDAVDRMKRDKVGALVVSDDGHEIQGIISERDILHALASHGTALMGMAVEDIMTRRVEACRPDDSLKQIMSVMTQRRFRHMPVVDEDGLCGMVSIGDVVVQRLEDAELETNVARESFSLSR